MDSALSTIQSLTKREDEDKEALATLMASVQASRGLEAEQEAKITAMKQELEERSDQLTSSAARLEKMVRCGEPCTSDAIVDVSCCLVQGEQLQEAHSQLERVTAKHRKELRARDLEVSVHTTRTLYNDIYIYTVYSALHVYMYITIIHVHSTGCELLLVSN